MAHFFHCRPRQLHLPGCTSQPSSTSYARLPSIASWNAFPSHPRISRREFSCKIRLCARGSPSAPQQREKAQKSLKIILQEGQEGQLPEDFGLLPGTFVKPVRANRPSIFKAPRARLKLEWSWLKRRAINLGSLLGYITTAKPRLKMHLRKTAPTAVALHHQMYTAFAAGNIPTLSALCAPGLLSSFSSRIASRRGDDVTWTLNRHMRPAKVVSDRAARLRIPGAALRQAVVRIESEQSLTRYSTVAKPGEGKGQQRRKEKTTETREYLVIQRLTVKGKEGKWKVWGTTEETGVEWLEEEARREKAEIDGSFVEEEKK